MTLTLLHLPLCPFCIEVRRAAERLGVALRLIDASSTPQARRILLRARGRATVPVLLFERDGEPVLLPESDDIIAFREEHAEELSNAA